MGHRNETDVLSGVIGAPARLRCLRVPTVFVQLFEEESVPTTKQRRQTARRRLERQLVRRAELARRRRARLQIFAAVVAVLLIAGVSWLVVAKTGKDNKPNQAAAQPSGSPTASPGPTGAPVPVVTFAKTKHAIAKTSGPCKYTETAATQSNTHTKDVGLPPDPKPTPTARHAMTLNTSQGTIGITLNGAKAPCTVQSFDYLLGKKFLDNTYCHRLTTSTTLAVLQCGDPSGSGEGGPTYQVKDENLKGATYKRGTVAMANAGANTNGSQFFLVYKDSQLPPNYTPIGTISSGLDVLDKIGKAGSDNSNGDGDGKPILGVHITTATVK
jgi:peptidyl-prolyl cis-trans isomerase B (cyclophilin B)